MSRSAPANSVGGFTLIELLVAVAIVAILAALATPSFTSLFAKKRVEGLVSELVTDLQLARSESVQRNTIVQLTLGTNCYVIHALSSAATVTSANTSCTQNSASTIGSGEVEIKTVQIISGSPASFSPATGSIIFDPVRGMATISTGAGTITATSSIGSWVLRAVTPVNGRVTTCSPTGTGNIAGFPIC